MDQNQFEKVPTRQIESGVVDIAITKQLIKEIGNPLDLVRECLSNSAAKEVGATYVTITIFSHPDYGYVFEFKDDGCGMNLTGNLKNPGRLDRFLRLGLAAIVGLPTDEFGFKGIGSKLAFRSKRIELETYTRNGNGYKVWINEPWGSIERGFMPKAHVTDLPQDPEKKAGTHLKIYGYPADRLEEVRQGRLSFTFDNVKNYLLHRSFAGFTHERENPPIITLKVGKQTEHLENGFPLLKRMKKVEEPEEGTNYIDIRSSKVLSGTNRSIRIHLKGLYTVNPQDWDLDPQKFNAGLILSVKGIPYCELNIRKFIKGYFVTNPGPEKLCIICECDEINEDMNIPRSNYNPSAITGVFEELLQSMLIQLGSRPEYGLFVMKSRQQKQQKKADKIRRRKEKLMESRNDIFLVEEDGSERWIHTEPENEQDTLALLWKLEALEKLPFAQFKTLATSRVGPDLLVDFQETKQSQPELLTVVEAEYLFRNYRLHGHTPGQMPIVVCWDIGGGRRVTLKPTNKPWKFLADIEDIKVRIFMLKHLGYLRIKKKKTIID